MSQHFKETAALHTDLKKFGENYDQISWGQAAKKRCDQCGHIIDVIEIYNGSRWIRDDLSCPCGKDHRPKKINIDSVLEKIISDEKKGAEK